MVSSGVIYPLRLQKVAHSSKYVLDYRRVNVSSEKDS
jgi:hypothetical protein